MTPSQKSQAIRSYRMQNSRSRGSGYRRMPVSRPLSQGVGITTFKPFGSTRPSGVECWNAFHPSHLALPRPVGPYAVIRTTRAITMTTENAIIGTFRAVGAPNSWSRYCYAQNTAAGAAVNIGAANNTDFYINNLTPVGDALTCVPSALSVQIMNGEALQTTSGIVYAGVMNTQAAVGGRAETWTSYASKFIAYQNPRVMSAGKLALRGVQINSYPLSMSQLSEFLPMSTDADNPGATWSSTAAEPAGFAPIVIHNPSGVLLECLICIEWRVRFDLSNPAAGSHVHHPISSDNKWEQAMKQAVALGNGVMDIAELVAAGYRAVQPYLGAAKLAIEA